MNSRKQLLHGQLFFKLHNIQFALENIWIKNIPLGGNWVISPAYLIKSSYNFRTLKFWNIGDVMLRFDVISIDVYFVELLASTVYSAPHVLLELLPRVSH